MHAIFVSAIVTGECLNQGQIHTSCTGSNIGSVTTVSCVSQIVVSFTYTDLGRFKISTISTNLVQTLLFTSFTDICLMAHFSVEITGKKISRRGTDDKIRNNYTVIWVRNEVYNVIKFYM
jgi:hypothetical protein